MTPELVIVEKPSLEEEIKWAFPDVDPGATPLGGRILLQVRRIRKRTTGGLILTSETKDVEKFNTQVGKLVAVGSLAFKKKDDMTPWPEGAWAQVGDFVRAPRFGGDRWEVAVEGDEEPALFLICNDHELIAKVTVNPLQVKAYL